MNWRTCILGLVVALQSFASEEVPVDVMIAYKALLKYQETYEVPGVMAVVYYEGNPYFFPIGVANLETEELVTKETIFALGSITKSFTAIMLAEAVLNGQVNLDDTVGPYLPGASIDGPFSRITFRQLATHTAGLPREIKRMRVLNREQLAEALQSLQFSQLPGVRHLYSNLGFGLLGIALERVTHTDFWSLLKSDLLHPLKMHRTFIGFPQGLPAAKGYNEEGGPAIVRPVSNMIASGALRSCGDDMAKFLAACLGLPGTPAMLLQAIRLTEQENFPLNKGRIQTLSWVKHNIRGKAVFVKNGSIPGFSAFMGYIPELKSGIVILANKKSNNTTVGLSILSYFVIKPQ